VHAQRYGLVFLTALEAEVPPLFVLEAQNRFIEVLLLYFDNDLSETVLREQFSTVYQLLDEMVDGG
jgi:AP-3 complex subunit mu